MAACRLSIHESLVKEIENINDVDELKEVSKTLIKENSALCRKSKAASKGLEKQNRLIEYLQDALDFTMAQHAERAKLIYTILGTESVRALDKMMRYRSIITSMSESNQFKGKEKKRLNEMLEIVQRVPVDHAEEAQDKFMNFLAKLDGLKVPKDDTDVNEDYDKEDNNEHIKDSDVKDFVKKENAVLRRERNSRSAMSLVSGNKSQSSTKNLKKKGLKKPKVLNKCHLEESKSTKKNRGTSNCSISTSINEPIDLKDLEIKLIDFMHDISADNDPVVARFKQAWLKLSKFNEEVLEAIDVDSDQKVESDNFDKSDENDIAESKIIFKSAKSEDSILSKSGAAASCQESTVSDAIPGKEGPSMSLNIPGYINVPDYIDIPDMSRKEPSIININDK